ncbi:hypothetical protein PybrP1_001990 [[Pythium] brassicae (nom. inval.)]|nr:hypothetical protein PybrP1_001990 [[Pythium] brassicae (nom. inval.)]
MEAPLPSVLEFDDPLAAHLDDLEEPGATFLHDFLVRPANVTTTPLSNATDTPNGYTSEETDYAYSTPPPPPPLSDALLMTATDEQMYQDMSFLQSADTSELVEVVADFCSTEDLTTLSPQQQRKFAGKGIKGKTSKYRGVTQTSKTSWGAKYSAKRITNTCKTPDEAAHAYDMYLKQHYPQKYSKFANFCETCGRFVNPLGLPEYKSECGCTDRPQSASPSAGDVTSPESSAAGSPVNSASESEPPDFRSSNLSVGSMKFSFSDDNDKFFDESLAMVASFETAQQQQQQQQQATVLYPDFEPSSPSGGGAVLQKRDSIPLTVISSAIESFTKEDNLDQIIEDITRPSNPAGMPFAKPPMAPTSGGSSSSVKPDFQHSIEPTSSSSTYVDFSMDELQDLSEYFLTDQFVPQEMLTSSSGGGGGGGGGGGPPASSINRSGKQANLKKIHSLDFDSYDVAMDDGVKSEQQMQDIEAIASSFMHPTRPHAVAPSLIVNSFPAVIEIQTPFLEKYWRNDRKNIQCFPYCPEHGDYYRVRIEDLAHRCKGVCRAAIKAHITVPTGQLLEKQGLLVLARCNSTFSRNEALSSQAFLNTSEMKSLQSVSAIGAIDAVSGTLDGTGVQFDVTFYPDVWKFEFDLPKKRRNISANSPVETDVDHLGSEFLYFFEIDVFYSAEKTIFQRLGHSESINFQIGNTRTLLRQRNKMTEDATPTTGGADSDRVLDVDALPEKKKVKMHRGQLAASSASISEEFDPSLVSKDKNAAPSPPPQNARTYITGEGISSASRQGEWIDPKKPMDVDQYFRVNSKDSVFNMELGDGAVSSSLDPETQSSNYNPYFSPKQKGEVLATAAIASSVHGATQQAPMHKPAAASADAYSLAALFPYSLVCVLISVVFLPLSLLLLVAFLVLPPLAPAVVRVLDTLSDSELRRANSSCVARDSRRVLLRLAFDPASGSSKLFRYHSSGAVWSRFAYFVGVKLLVSVLAFVPTLLLSVLSLLVFPIRPLSIALKQGACSCALWTREYTRSSVGKAFAGGDAGVVELV